MIGLEAIVQSAADDIGCLGIGTKSVDELIFRKKGNVLGNRDIKTRQGLRGKIDGVPFQSSFMALGNGKHKLPLKAATLREIAKVPGDSVRDKITDINRIIAKLDDQRHVFYMDIGSRFLDERGYFLADAFRPDNLHPQAKGYDIWGAAVKDQLAQMMGRETIR